METLISAVHKLVTKDVILAPMQALLVWLESHAL